MTVEQIIVDAHRRLGVRIIHCVKRVQFSKDRFRYVCEWCGINSALRADEAWLSSKADVNTFKAEEGEVLCKDLVS